MSPRAREPEPRSLADDLRSRPDGALRDLLALRPDLAVPTPADVTALAARASTRASAQRALDRLDAGQLRVVEAVAVLAEPAGEAGVAALLGLDAISATAALADLQARALVWGRRGAWRLVRTARDALGSHPAGLGPPLAETLDRRSPRRLEELAQDLGVPPTGDPDTTIAAIAAHLGDGPALEALLAAAPAGAGAVLERLTWGPPVGEVSHADRDVRAGSATRPLDWLLAHGLLAVADPGHVVLPREIALHLRGGRLERADAGSGPPPLSGPLRPRGQVDRTAGASAADTVRLVEELLSGWGEHPPPLLRTGGLGVRDLRSTAATLDVDEPTAAALIEIAYAAGLLASDAEASPRFAPTPAYDVWVVSDIEDRWAHLVRAWWHMTRTPALVGTRDDRGATRNALVPDLDRPIARELRQAAVLELADGPVGGPAGKEQVTAVDHESLLARMRWRRPRRRSVLMPALVQAGLREAELLGVTGLGALSTPGRALVEDGAAASDAAAGLGERLAGRIRRLLPEPVDHVLLQADLTAVAPGPLVPEVHRLMAAVADIESRGGGAVYRIDAGTVRRALDLGWASSDLLARLAAASRTPVPQPLTYLIEDVARRHGTVRVGVASAYLRSEDPAVLDELVADRRLAGLRLRRLAPTVVVAQAEAADVLDTLREHGRAPALEAPDGTVLLARATSRRTPPRTPPRPVVTDPPEPAAAVLDAIVHALREGDRDADAERAREADRPGPRLGPTDPATAMGALRDAIADRSRVWIGYVDGDGRPVRRVIEPLGVEGGRVRAYDVGSSEVREFSVHRITGVAPVDVAT